MKIKLHDWLMLCLFGLSVLFVTTLFSIVYINLEETLLKRTRDQLNSINILKKKLLEQVLSDQQTEAYHIIQYHTSHRSGQQELLEALEAMTDLKSTHIYAKADFGELSKFGKSKFFTGMEFTDGRYFIFNYLGDTNVITLKFEFNSLIEILEERTGLGNTGESYMVSEKFHLVSPSIFFPNKNPEEIEAKTFGAMKAMNGEIGVALYQDYRDVYVMGSYRIVQFEDIKMAILTEIDYNEALNPIREIRNNLIVLFATMLILSLIGSSVIARMLAMPVKRFQHIADQLSLGKLPENQYKGELIFEFQSISDSLEKLVGALKATVLFAEHIGEGNMDMNYSTLSDGDELGHAIMMMREQLIRLDQEKTHLEKTSKRMLIETQEKERERISRDLHDGLGTLLTTMKMKMSHEGILNKDPELARLLDSTINETRSLARNLMPSVLLDFGWEVAIKQLLEIVQKNTDIKVNFSHEQVEVGVALEKSKQVYVYRIAQEIINNAIKHAQCQVLNVSITAFEDHVILFVKDDGIGMTNHGQYSNGLGFKNIEERVSLLNGQLFIESEPSGTSIEVNIPII